MRNRECGGVFAAQFDMERPANQRKLDLVEPLATLAAATGVSLPHMAIAFVLSHPAVTSAIIGPRTMAQLEDLLAGAELRLDGATLDAIDALVPPGTTVDENDRGWVPWWGSDPHVASGYAPVRPPCPPSIWPTLGGAATRPKL
ncbi:MAG: hypothetical protein B7Z68_08180 [Acidobacteria bacterium 21-70-11]|nr:MAG: hypothetical protein B7Z68_08180 [Acidobacteria bacterium 21-70-11]